MFPELSKKKLTPNRNDILPKLNMFVLQIRGRSARNAAALCIAARRWAAAKGDGFGGHFGRSSYRDDHKRLGLGRGAINREQIAATARCRPFQPSKTQCKVIPEIQ